MRMVRHATHAVTSAMLTSLRIQHWWSLLEMNRADGAHGFVVAATWGFAPCWYKVGRWPTKLAAPLGQRQRRDRTPTPKIGPTRLLFSDAIL
jgi:hypothetical protein